MRRVFISVLLAFGSLAGLAQAAAFPPLPTAAMDLKRYMGQWYEVARLDNRFQRSCASGTFIRYSLRLDGKFDVYNECKDSSGKPVISNAVGRKAEASGPDSKLKVTFIWPFSADYWVIDLDKDYRWALTGQPGRDYLWILSREPHLEEAIYQRLVDSAKKLGFDVGKLVRTNE